MTATDAARRRASVRSRDRATLAYIIGVWGVAAALWVSAVSIYGAIHRYLPLLALSGLAAAAWRVGTNELESRVQFAAGHIAVLAAVSMLTPAAAGVVGLSMTVAARGPVPLRARLFNLGMWTAVATAGGITYQLVGGVNSSASLRSSGPLLMHVGVPLMVADVVQTVLNAVLLAVVIRITAGTPVRVQLIRLFSTTGLTAVGYGALAFVLVVLWLPAGLGPASVILILAPMLGAWWAYRQYGEERAARERTLDVLVAAIETKAPHLAGHSARVAELSGAMAEQLGLRPREVRDTKTAGMLHDVGLVALPSGVVAGHPRPRDPALSTYPARGAHILREVSFLAGSLEGIAHHGDDEGPGAAAASGRGPGVSARVVRAADRFDLLTRVAAPDVALPVHEAVDRLRAEADPEDLRVLDALVAALARQRDGSVA